MINVLLSSGHTFHAYNETASEAQERLLHHEKGGNRSIKFNVGMTIASHDHAAIIHTNKIIGFIDA